MMKMEKQVKRGIEASQKALDRLMMMGEYASSAELDKAIKEHAKRVRKCNKELSKRHY